MAESEIPPVPKLTLGRLASQGQLVSSRPPAYFPLGDGTSANQQPHPFSYLNMCTKRPHNAQYRSSRHDGYAHFSLIALDHIPDDLSPREHGLKIHISLDDEIPGNVANGWNVVVNVLMQYNVARAKVVPSDNQGNLTKKDDPEDGARRGKQITIYASLHDNQSNWQPVLQSITTALLQHEIAPGYKPDPAFSKTVNNNCYLSYRDDFNPLKPKSSRRPSRASDGGPFLEGAPDPLSNISVPTPRQLSKALPNTINTITSSSTSNSNVSATESVPHNHLMAARALRDFNDPNNNDFTDMHSAHDNDTETNAHDVNEDAESSIGIPDMRSAESTDNSNDTEPEDNIENPRNPSLGS